MQVMRVNMSLDKYDVAEVGSFTKMGIEYPFSLIDEQGLTLDTQTGQFIQKGIQRIKLHKINKNRIDYKERFKEIGFPYYDIPSLDGTDYWVEDRAMLVSPLAKKQLEDAANELHKMCMDFVDEVCTTGNFPREFNLTEEAKQLILDSYAISKKWGFFDSFYGRFDLAFRNEKDGNLTIKLIEYNADTPTSTIESAVAQKMWLHENTDLNKFKSFKQFNNIHEDLINAWKKFILTYQDYYQQPLELIHFAGADEEEDNREDFSNLYYIAETARIAYSELEEQGLLKTDYPELTPENRLGIIGMAAIGEDQIGGFIDENNPNQRYYYFYDDAMERWGNEEDNPIQALFKLYPYEYMMGEEFFSLLKSYETVFIEPVWKMLLSNKSLLVELWKRHPNHPLLLEAYYDTDDSEKIAKLLVKPHVKKARLAREGANVFIAKQDNGVNVYENTTEFVDYYDESGYVYQEYFYVEPMEGYTPIIGLWIIGNKASGLNFRDDFNPITSNDSHFVSHVVASLIDLE